MGDPFTTNFNKLAWHCLGTSDYCQPHFNVRLWDFSACLRYMFYSCSTLLNNNFSIHLMCMLTGHPWHNTNTCVVKRHKCRALVKSSLHFVLVVKGEGNVSGGTHASWVCNLKKRKKNAIHFTACWSIKHKQVVYSWQSSQLASSTTDHNNREDYETLNHMNILLMWSDRPLQSSCYSVSMWCFLLNDVKTQIAS